MPILGGTANPLLGRTLLNLLDKQRAGTPPETPPDVNLDVERARQTLDPFGFQAPTADPVYDWGRLAGNILGGKGIVLARGGAGREALAHIRRAIGPYLERLVKSPRVYTVEQLSKQELADVAPSVNIGATGIRRLTHTEPDYALWVAEQLGRGRPLPEWVTRIMTTPEGGASVGPHEAAHALGYERLLQRLGGWEGPVGPHTVARAGGRHADLLGDPRTHQMLRESLQRWPSLGDFYATYRHSTASPYTGLGELLNEAWAQRQAFRQGVQRIPAPEMSWYQRSHGSSLPALRARYADELESLRRTGQLPPTLHENIATQPPLMQKIRSLHEIARQPNVSNEVLGKALLEFLKGMQ